MNKPKELSAEDIEEIKTLAGHAGKKPTPEIEKLWEKWASVQVTLLLIEKLSHQASRISELEAGLKFYADPNSWFRDAQMSDKPYIMFGEEIAGETARKLLSPKDTQGEG